MAGIIKLFQRLKKFYHTNGLIIDPSKSDQNCSFNAKNLFFLLILTISFVSVTSYFIFEAESAIERSQTFYSALAELACVFNFIFQFWKIANVLKLIDQFDRFIEKSEF